MMKRFLIPLLLCAAATVFARGRIEWLPGALEKKADIICEGIPLKIVETDERLVMQDVPMRVAVATIKVTAKVKGDVPGQFEFRFRELDWDKMPGPQRQIIDGPIQADLTPGKRYRFLLKKDAKGNYVGILDDYFDDGQAVVPVEEKGAVISR